MICLFLDTSSDNLIVSLVKNNEVVFEKSLNSLRDHSTYLVPFINEAFKTNNIDIKDLDKIFVGIGPGSFTGTRIAITVAKVLSYSVSADLIPVSSLQKYIYSVEEYDYYVPILEERKDMLYFSIFDKNKNRVIDDCYASKEELLNHLSHYNGKIALISDLFYDGYDVHKKNVDVLSMLKYLENEKGVNPHILKPNYIKRIEVESKL